MSKSAATTGSGTPSAAPVSGPRIISTVPAATEQLLQIGAADLLVGVSTYDAPILPPGKENLPVVGDYDTLDYELLVKLRPTALVVQMTPSHITSAVQKIIADQHIELVNVKLDSLSDLYATAAALGRISGHQREADSAIAATRTALADIERQWADGPQPRVAYLLSASGMMIVGRGTFMDEILAIAGCRNVGAKIGDGYPTTNREALIKLSPDVLLIAAPGEPAGQGMQDPRITPWIDLPIPAARQDRIYLVTDPSGQLLTLSIADQLRSLARTIHQADPPFTPSTTSKATP